MGARVSGVAVAIEAGVHAYCVDVYASVCNC